jgi:hypothetical protein
MIINPLKWKYESQVGLLVSAIAGAGFGILIGYRSENGLLARRGVLFCSSCSRRMRQEGLRRISPSCRTCCARIEWWIGSLPIGRRSLRPSSQSALLSWRCLSSRSLDGRYYAGLDRSLNARVDPTNTPRARPYACKANYCCDRTGAYPFDFRQSRNMRLALSCTWTVFACVEQ